MLYTALKKVFLKPSYWLLAAVVALIVFVVATWLPNFKLIAQITILPTASLEQKLSVLIALLGSIRTNFDGISASYTISLAVLFGINTAMVVYYFKRQKNSLKQKGLATSLGGFVSGMFGIGCAACGTLVLGPLLALIGGGGAIALLPLGGQEFGFIGVGLMAVSIYLSSKKIVAPAVCEDPQKPI